MMLTLSDLTMSSPTYVADTDPARYLTTVVHLWGVNSPFRILLPCRLQIGEGSDHIPSHIVVVPENARINGVLDFRQRS